MTEATKKPVVVVVDDNDHVLRAMRVVLARRYAVHTSNDPEKAVPLVKQVNPAVVITDVRMPRHDGFWLFSEIRKFNATVPIIFNSAFQDAMDQSDVIASYQPFAYVVKGDDMNEFLRIIAAAVAEGCTK